MTAPRDPDRLIDLFLAEGLDELPVRSYDAVRSDIDRIRQRAVFIDPWRTFRMNSYMKLALAAAAVVVLALAGSRLLPNAQGPGGPRATPAALPTSGHVPAGSYAVAQGGVQWTFTLTTDEWFSQAGDSAMLTIGPRWGASTNGGMISFSVEELNARHGAYPDPCNHDEPGPLAGKTVPALASMLAATPNMTVTGPTNVTVGGRSATYLELATIDPLPCAPNGFWLGYGGDPGGCGRPEGCMRWVTADGTTEYIWLLDVNGKRMWIDAETYAGGTPERVAEIHATINSIKFQ